MSEDQHGARAPMEAAPYRAIIVGAGFAGIGMAVALKRQGLDNILILERSQDVGGVWRDNSYPGAACDVPSHLYSFSFEPNPRWSRVFATQPEIHDYLRHCAQKYDLLRHVRFAAEVAQAAWDERYALWRVTLRDGTRLASSILITGTGQLSRPVLPRIDGIDTFRGPAFHSAHWNHQVDLAGKRVAVIGTGASAIQFVPAIAGRVGTLSVFQRSPAYIVARPDRPYTAFERAMFRALPWSMKLYRAGIYAKYEFRAVAFTRLRGLMQVAVGMPFRRLLRRQVPDAALRQRLMPDYPIGCKRILLSSDYLPAMSRPNVKLVTDAIRRITPAGVETVDGTVHEADAIIYGTGFAATEFLAPMRITGRDGLLLDDAWKDGANAYLGLTVPGFPNFFMLYGPNTNLGHNSIVYMLESQVAHVMRCLGAMRDLRAETIEVDALRHERYNARVQRRLAHTVWNGCRSWYLDAKGHNSTNWPGFTLSYRWLARFSPLSAYSFTHKLPLAPDVVEHAEPPGEGIPAHVQRLMLRSTFRPLIGPPLGPRAQRLVVAVLSLLMPGVRDAVRTRTVLGGVPADIATPQQRGPGVILYLHGGAFMLGSAWTHRSVTTRLAAWSGMQVVLPEYRLAPEHPYPAALEDALSCYEALLAQGVAPHQVVVAGDSAGGMLALALALRLRERGQPMPASLLLLSPLADLAFGGDTIQSRQGVDPMVRPAWGRQAAQWYGCPAAMDHRPLEADLRGLPPMLVQVGDEEVLLSDSTRLAQHAARCGVPCRLEVYAGRWHVFQLSAFYLGSARAALRRLARFAQDSIAAREKALSDDVLEEAVR